MKAAPLLSLATLLLACQKEAEEEKLPPATQTGANTGGYLLNGQAIVANGVPGKYGLLSSTPATPALYGAFLNDSTVFLQLVSLYCSQRYYLHLFVRCRNTGTYDLNRNTARYSGYGAESPQLRSYGYVALDGTSCEPNDTKHYFTYLTDPLYTGSVTIRRLDRAAGTAAGTFEFSARNQQGQTPIQITKGRFDFKR